MNREIQELREVIEKLVPLLSGRNLKVTQRGTKAYVRANPRTNQPECVNIPSIPDNASPDFIGAVSGFIDHEVGHVLHTDWKYYGCDGVKLDKFSPEGKALTNMHNIIEDTYIEREQVKIFPGSARNLERLHKHFLEKITGPAVASAKGNQALEFSYLIVPMMRALSGQEIFQEFMDKNGHWKHPMIENLHLAMSEEALELIKTARTTKETLEVAQEVHDILFRQKQEEERKKREEEEKKKQAGKSQDKPEKKAGEGDGTGERDHSEQEPGEEGSAGAEDEDAGGATGDEPDDEGAEGDADAEVEETGAGGDAADPEDDEGDAAEPEGEGKGGAKSKSEEPEPEKNEDGEGEGEPDEGEGEVSEEDDEAESEAGAGADGSDEDEGEEDEEGEAGASSKSDEGDEDESEEEAGTGAASTDEEPEDEDGDELGEDGAPDEEEEYEDNAGDETGGNDNESQGGGGVGGEAGKSMFDLDPDDFAPLDLGNAMAQQIEEMARVAVGSSSYSVFTKDEDRIEVFETDDKLMNPDWVPEMDDAVSGMVGPMQKEIERLMAAQALAVRTSGHRSGRLHSASLYRVLQGDDRVFQRKEEHRTKDTAVMLLCDNSGSMSGDKMRVAMQSAYALAQTLERVNIPNEIIGFTTGSLSHDALQQLSLEYSKGISFHRTSSIIMPIYKKFEERVTPAVKRRIAFQVNKQVGLYNNTDGESLEYAAWRLIPRREKRKVMLVLSDGQPVGSGSGPHLADTVRRLNKMGVETVGIGIQSNAVEKFYPRSMVLNRVADLPAAVMGELRRILTN